MPRHSSANRHAIEILSAVGWSDGRILALLDGRTIAFPPPAPTSGYREHVWMRIAWRKDGEGRAWDDFAAGRDSELVERNAADRAMWARFGHGGSYDDIAAAMNADTERSAAARRHHERLSSLHLVPFVRNGEAKEAVEADLCCKIPSDVWTKAVELAEATEHMIDAPSADGGKTKNWHYAIGNWSLRKGETSAADIRRLLMPPEDRNIDTYDAPPEVVAAFRELGIPITED